MTKDKTIEETKKVWKHHIEAWDAGDLDEIMVDYGEVKQYVVFLRVCFRYLAMVKT
ncbi:MAG: hypothetical protein RIM23_01650 [Coleofasciculus sp. G3-WIS-01]|uniref:hypothetical protein n=1 Tax=Coleofasciculus sp. G3-WIS-01 TaxID=3069528 RepID=UPI0032F60C54